MSQGKAAKARSSTHVASAMTRPRRTVAEPSPATPDAHAPALQQSVGNYAVIGLAQRGTPALVQSVLERSGQPLAGRLRAQMESRFGQSFAPVRVHTDVAAAASAEALDAHAYSVGNDIVFGPGEFAPATASGTRLLAHELAHVVQQRRGGNAPLPGAGTPHESAADTAAAAVASGKTGVAVGGATGVGIARKPKDRDRRRRPSDIADEDRHLDEQERKARLDERRAERERGKVRSGLRQEGGPEGELDREIKSRMQRMDSPEFRSRNPKHKDAETDRITQLARDRAALERAGVQHGVSDVRARQQRDLMEDPSLESRKKVRRERARVRKVAGQKEAARAFGVSKTKGQANELGHVSQQSVETGSAQVAFVNRMRQERLPAAPGEYGSRRVIDELREKPGRGPVGDEDKKIGLPK